MPNIRGSRHPAPGEKHAGGDPGASKSARRPVKHAVGSNPPILHVFFKRAGIACSGGMQGTLEPVLRKLNPSDADPTINPPLTDCPPARQHFRLQDRLKASATMLALAPLHHGRTGHTVNKPIDRSLPASDRLLPQFLFAFLRLGWSRSKRNNNRAPRCWRRVAECLCMLLQKIDRVFGCPFWCVTQRSRHASSLPQPVSAPQSFSCFPVFLIRPPGFFVHV